MNGGKIQTRRQKKLEKLEQRETENLLLESNVMASLSPDEENGVQADQREDAQNVGEGLLREMISDLRDFKKDMHSAMSDLKGDIKKDLKEEMTSLKHELNQKLTEVGVALQAQGRAIAEAEERIAAVEESGSVTKDTMLSLLKEQRRLRDKVTDLESRSRRNNIRIYGVQEGIEGDSMIKFVEDFLTRELTITDGMPLQIQRAHRALAQKPSPEATPRSIVVNFLQFEVKETILKLAWKKKVRIDNKQIFFDYDYAYEVMERRRAYGGIKKALKEKGIRFQTPFTKIRIHWSTGLRTYEDAHEATSEMRKRGFELAAPRGDSSVNMEERIQRAFPWQRAGERSGERRLEMRVKEKLQPFRRASSQE